MSGWKVRPAIVRVATVIVLGAGGFVLGGADEPVDAHPDLQRALGILQYVAGDYCEAVDEEGRLLAKEELDEQLELLDDVLGILAEQPGPASRTILRQARDVRRHVVELRPPRQVAPELRSLHARIVDDFDVQIAPTTVPALPVGRLVYESSCAACHGATGDARTPIATTLDPRPRSFLAPEQEVRLSPYAVFAAVSWGIPGTAMPGFETLEEDERWSVAFYVASLRQASDALAPQAAAANVPAQSLAGDVPALSVRDLAFATDRELLELLHGVPEHLRRAQLRRWRLDLPLEVGR